jgi:hypothetical protein
VLQKLVLFGFIHLVCFPGQGLITNRGMKASLSNAGSTAKVDPDSHCK